jgi:glycosyltransferase involved in cell wall biosynthesis
LKLTSQIRIPAVSILVATHNNAPYLREALDTLLGQTFPDFELIVVDDGSTDETQQILSSYRDARLVLLRNERRHGVAAARNRTIAVSRAPLLAVADADDRYDLRRLEKQVRFFDKHPEVDIAVSDFYLMTGGGKVFGRVRVPRTDALIKLHFTWQNELSHPTALCRRAVVLRSGGYDESFSSAVDTDWFARMSEYAVFGVITDPLHYNRKHPTSTSANHDPQQAAKRFGISHRLMCKLLGREVSVEDGEIIKDLLCAYVAVRPEALAVGFRLLDELARCVAAKESPATLRWFKRKAGESLTKQSVYQTYSCRPASRILLKRALGFSPGQCARRRAWVHVIRLLLAPLHSRDARGTSVRPAKPTD